MATSDRLLTSKGKNQDNESELSATSGCCKKKEKSSNGFGKKTIGFFGGWCLLWNNITGPGMVTLVTIFQEAGWLPSILMLVAFGAASYFAGYFLIKAMSGVPGNENFDQRVEMMFLCKEYLPRVAYLFCVVAFLFNLQIANISAIIESTQTADYTIMAIFGRSCALCLNNFTALCVEETSGANMTNTTGAFGSSSPFGDNVWVISIGFLLVLVITIPLGLVNLDDNIWVQIVTGMVLLCFVVTTWVYEFGRQGLDFANVPAAGSGLNIFGNVGVVIFNYAFIVTIPSWVNEKKPKVSANWSLISSLIPSVVAFVVIGFLGAASNITGADCRHALDAHEECPDLLSQLSGPKISTVARIATFLFPWMALVSGIPIFSIIIRYNMLENNLCRCPCNAKQKAEEEDPTPLDTGNKREFDAVKPQPSRGCRIAQFLVSERFLSDLFAVVFPWIVALIFYAGNFISIFINWGSLLTTIPLNFALPCFLFIAVRRRNRQQLNATADASGTAKSAGPCAAAELLAWVILILSGIANVIAIVASGLSCAQGQCD